MSDSSARFDPTRSELPPSIDPDAFRLVDVLETIMARMRGILKWTLGVAVVTAVITLLLPRWYRSEATIFGPEEASEERRLLSNLSSLAIPGVRPKAGLQTPETFIAILESRTLREKIVERFDLVNAFGADGVEGCLRRLGKRVTIEFENTGVIQIIVIDTDRERAAAIANAMVEELDRMNIELRIYKSRRARQHLETQTAAARARLVASEDSLANFQQANMAVSITDQSRAAVDAISELEAKAIELRIRKGFLESFVTPENPELKTVTRELAEVESQIKRMELGSDNELSFSRLPALGLRLGQLLREVKTNEVLLALLVEEYEQARLDEAKETPVVQLLDRAVVAEKRFKPKRSMIIICATVAAFFVISLCAVAIDRYQLLATSEERSRWSALGRGLRRLIPSWPQKA